MKQEDRPFFHFPRSEGGFSDLSLRALARRFTIKIFI
jgi:hypothetical protein